MFEVKKNFQGRKKKKQQTRCDNSNLHTEARYLVHRLCSHDFALEMCIGLCTSCFLCVHLKLTSLMVLLSARSVSLSVQFGLFPSAAFLLVEHSKFTHSGVASHCLLQRYRLSRDMRLWVYVGFQIGNLGPGVKCVGFDF
jgi:hypothetical protein